MAIVRNDKIFRYLKSDGTSVWFRYSIDANGAYQFLFQTGTSAGDQTLVTSQAAFTNALNYPGPTVATGDVLDPAIMTTGFPDGTVTAPGIFFANDTGTGFYRPAASTIGVALGGVNTATFSGSAGITLTALGTNQGITLTPNGTGPINLNTAGGGTRIPNTATAGLQLYNTANQTSNYERLSLLWIANAAMIRSIADGTGTLRGLSLRSGSKSDGTIGVEFAMGAGTGVPTVLNLASNSYTATAGALFSITQTASNSATSSSYSFLSLTPKYNQSSGTAANTDLLINRTETAVGSGAQLLMDLQVGSTSKFKVDNTGKATSSSDFQAGSSAAFLWNGRSQMRSAGNGVIALYNSGLSDFGQLQFGGTSNAFPSIKRSTTELQARLADDSAYTYVVAKLRGSDGTAGANFTGAITNLTVVDGVVTAAS